MKAEIGNHPLDAAGADHGSQLSQLLGNHLDRRLGIQKSIADDLPDNVVRAAVVGLGTTLLVDQPHRALFHIQLAELEVALLGVTMLLGRGKRPHPVALPFDQHRQFARDIIIGTHGQRARLPD